MVIPITKKVVTGIPTAAVASYDGFDIAKGTGLIEFFGARVDSGASAAYVLTQAEFDSSQVVTKTNASDVTLGEGSYGIVNNLNFDVEFKRPNIVQGQVIVAVPHGAQGVVASKDYNSYIHARFKVLSNGVETEYANSSCAVTNIDGQNIEYKTSAIRLEVPQTLIKANDTLRINLEQHGECVNAGSNANFFIAHDPSDRRSDEDETTSPETHLDLASGSTVLKVQVPFRIDI